jgi:hypothetical protein
MIVFLSVRYEKGEMRMNRQIVKKCLGFDCDALPI